ncbi:hypothetical protein [Bradyrhizobium uaiense]|uniref:Uncharacterized protein n=1 Tax=Bradyrhizobium uaiense TaxID=2594946 RepID=A0A6P1BBT4_9BRAD|nr:hypothetical protein [Bradyrhizobium uaiense]NEU94942.1 hypothetical protein [Bradyrhizobium uaiense]
MAVAMKRRAQLGCALSAAFVGVVLTVAPAVVRAVAILDSKIDFQGAVSLKLGSGHADLSIKSIYNKGTLPSGSLRISLWAAQAPKSGNSPNIQGYKTAEIYARDLSGGADVLGPNQSFDDLQLHLQFEPPADRAYNAYLLVVEERFANCSQPDHYCGDAYVNVVPGQ